MKTQNLDELTQYFDIFHNEFSNISHHTPTNTNNNQHTNYNYGNKSSNSNNKLSSASPRLKSDDVCPIHGGHTRHYCIFNKGLNSSPPTRNTATSSSAKESNDSFNDQQIHNETNDDDNTSNNPYDDDFKAVVPPNEPVPQVIIERMSGASDDILNFKDCLLDFAGTKSLIPLTRLRKYLIEHQSSQPYSAFSSSGVHRHHEYIAISNIRFPQFSTNIWLENGELIIFNESKHCAYGIIIGHHSTIRVHNHFRQK